MRKIIKLTLLLSLLALLTSPVWGLALISSDTAITPSHSAPTADNAKRVKQLAKQMQYASYWRKFHTISLSTKEIDSLFTVAASGIKRISGDSTINQQGAEIRASLHIPENPLGEYINVKIGFPGAAKQFELAYLSIGHITLKNSVATYAAKQLGDLVLGSQEGSGLLDTVKSIKTTKNHLLVSYIPTPHLDEKLASALRRNMLWGSNSADTVNNENVRHYYNYLCEHDNGPSRKLGPRLTSLLSYAKSQNSPALTTPAENNQAALIAAGIFYGNKKFNSLTNAVSSEELERCQKKAPLLKLAGRRDFAQHFIYSMTIKLLSDTQISFAIGEFKELSDSMRGGSGFSFADLAADQAGIQFAEFATADETAKLLQQRSNHLSSYTNFLPNISGLPEGLSQKEFEIRYGGINNEAYTAMADKIQNRIVKLPLYKR